MSPIKIIVHSIPDSLSIHTQVYKYYKKICRYYPRLAHCRVTIDLMKRKQTGQPRLFNVVLDVTIPGKELVARKHNKNLFLAIRDCFHAMDKALNKQLKRKMRAASSHSRAKYFDQLNQLESIENELPISQSKGMPLPEKVSRW